MTVKAIAISSKTIKFIGASTDTKPTAAAHAGLPEPSVGSTFFEYDTQALYITYDGTTWVLKDPFGEVKASPTSNTLLDRVKALLTGIVLAAGTAVIGKVGHDKTGIADGVVTVTTPLTDVPIVASSTPAKVVIIQAQTDNTGAIAVGGEGVVATIATGTGIILYAGDSITLEVDDLADVWIDAIVGGEGVRFTYLT